MIAAPDSSCCRLVALTKLLLWIAVTVTTITSASTMPSSRKRKISLGERVRAAARRRPAPTLAALGGRASRGRLVLDAGRGAHDRVLVRLGAAELAR